jgi:hypothetical protein
MRPTIDAAEVDDATLVVRTDYSDDEAWETLVLLLDSPQLPDHFEPVNYFVDDPAWHGATVDEVLDAAPDAGGVVFVADADAMRHPYPLLAVNTVTRADCADDDEYIYEMEFGREFRLLPAGVRDVSANLFVGNMDFPEFAEMAQDDPSGRYQGLAASKQGREALLALMNAHPDE